MTRNWIWNAVKSVLFCKNTCMVSHCEYTWSRIIWNVLPRTIF